jgi:hypothetical protein
MSRGSAVFVVGRLSELAFRLPDGDFVTSRVLSDQYFRLCALNRILGRDERCMEVVMMGRGKMRKLGSGVVQGPYLGTLSMLPTSPVGVPGASPV